MASNKEASPVDVRKDYAVLAAMAMYLLESSQYFHNLEEKFAVNGNDLQEESGKTDSNDQLVREDGTVQLKDCNAEDVINSIEEIKRIYAASLVHHMQIIQCNAYGIVESDSPSVGFRMKEAVYTGLGLYATMGLINHSCDPVLDISFKGSTAIYRSYKNVKVGGQITVDYGPIFYLQEKEERQVHLKANYYFYCQCDPCKFNWPTWDHIESKVPKLKCPLCDASFPSDVSISNNIKCTNCARSIDLLKFLCELGKSHKSYAVAMHQAKNGHFKDALPVLMKHLTLMQEVIALPWREFITCQSAIDQCYRMEAISD